MLHHNGLKIRRQESQGIVILELEGKLRMGDGDSTLSEYGETLLAEGSRKLAVDLANVSKLDTAGAGALVLLAQHYQETGGRMVLFHVDGVNGEVYELARLETVIDIYPDEIAAVNSFFSDRTPAHYDILEYVESQFNHEDHKE